VGDEPSNDPEPHQAEVDGGIDERAVKIEHDAADAPTEVARNDHAVLITLRIFSEVHACSLSIEIIAGQMAICKASLPVLIFKGIRSMLNYLFYISKTKTV